MTTLLPDPVRRYAGDEIRDPDFEVSWAGAGPSPGYFYFGSEDGRLRLVAAEGLVPQNEFPAAKSREAINGAASLDQYIAVSTRSEFTLWSMPESGEDRRGEFFAGAHGVIATASGQFVAPLGHTGLLVVEPKLDAKTPMMLIKPVGDGLYFYQVVSLDTPGHPETLVCASRQGGIAALAFPRHDRPDTERVILSRTFPGLDVIDLCSLGSDLPVPAACAAGKDCTLVFVRDVLSKDDPVTLRFDGVQGTAYRVMSARGHLFLLTSSSLYIFPGLISRFLNGEPIERQLTLVHALPMEVVDANLADDRWLLVVTTEGVRVIDVDLLVGQAPIKEPDREDKEIRPTPSKPLWKTQGHEITMAPAA